MSQYQKYSYWVDPSELKRIEHYVEGKGSSLAGEVHIPCRVLRPSIEMAYVSSQAWDGFCKRRTSWYWKSDKVEKLLIVSRTPLEGTEIEHPTVIEESTFTPDRFPTLDEMNQLIGSGEYQRRKPGEWDKVGQAEKDSYQRWFHRYGENGPFDFEKVFLSHSANHANFLLGRFFVTSEGARVPYSIADSLRTCSSCLEFFDILGSPWPVKYVVPCIGAVQFGRLPLNRYLRVEKAGRGEAEGVRGESGGRIHGSIQE